MLLLACFSLLTLTFGVTDGASVDHSFSKRDQDSNANVADRKQEGVRLPVQDQDELTKIKEASQPRYRRILAPILKNSEQVNQDTEMKNEATVSDANDKTRGRGPNLQVLTEKDSKTPTRERSLKEKSKLEDTMPRTPAPLTQTKARRTEEDSRPFSGAERADVATETQKTDMNLQGQDTEEDGSFPQQLRNSGLKDATSGDGSQQGRPLSIKPLRMRALRRNLEKKIVRRKRSTGQMTDHHETNSNAFPAYKSDKNYGDVSNVAYKDFSTSQEAYVQGAPEASSMNSPHGGEERHGGSNVYTDNLFAAASAIHKNTDIDEEKAWDDVMSRLHNPTPPETDSASHEESKFHAASARNTRKEALDSSSYTYDHDTGKLQSEKVEQVTSGSDNVDKEEINLAHRASVPEHFEATEIYRDSLSSGSPISNFDRYDHQPYIQDEASDAVEALTDDTSSSDGDNDPDDSDPEDTSAQHWVPESRKTLAANSYHYTSSDSHSEESAHIPSDEEDESVDDNEHASYMLSRESPDDESDYDDLVDSRSSYSENSDQQELDVNKYHTNGRYGYAAAIPNSHHDSYVDDASLSSDESLDGHNGAAQNEHDYLHSDSNHEWQAMDGSSSEEDSDESMIQGENSANIDKPYYAVHGGVGAHHSEDQSALREDATQFSSYSQAGLDKNMYKQDNDGHLVDLPHSRDSSMASASSEEHPYDNAFGSGDGRQARLEHADRGNGYNQLVDTHPNWDSHSLSESADTTIDSSDISDDDPDDSSAENLEAISSSSNQVEHPKHLSHYAARGHDSEQDEVSSAYEHHGDFSAYPPDHDDDNDDDDSAAIESKEYMGMTSHASSPDTSDVAWGEREFPAYTANHHELVSSENENGRSAVDEGHSAPGFVPRTNPSSVHSTQTYRRQESIHR